MKHLKHFILCSLIALASCSYYGSYDFVIYNTLEDTLEIDFSRNIWYPVETRDSNIIVLPNKQKLFFSKISEEIDKGNNPTGIDGPFIDEFGFINITIKGKKVLKDFKEIKYWEYNIAGDQVGIYTLYVNDTLIK